MNPKLQSEIRRIESTVAVARARGATFSDRDMSNRDLAWDDEYARDDADEPPSRSPEGSADPAVATPARPARAQSTAWDRFRGLPLQVVQDERLKSHHVDVLIALMEFTDLDKDRDRSLRMRGNVTTKLLASFTSINRSNLATYLADLRDFGYVVLTYDGSTIAGIRWNKKTSGLMPALRRRTRWIRIPVALIHDTTLRPVERHAYTVLVSHDFFRRERSPREESPVSFHCTTTLLARLMGVSQSSGKRLLKRLEELHLIEYVEGATLKGAHPMVLVPLNVRYAALKAPRGALAGKPKFEVHPRLEASVERWREEGRPIPYTGFGLEIDLGRRRAGGVS